MFRHIVSHARWPRAIAAALAACLVAAPLAAQSATGRITGTITTASGNPVDGALVSVRGTTLSGQTNSAGRFAITGVAPGTYELRVQRVGSRPQVIGGVVVVAGADASVAIKLEALPVQLGGVVVSASRRTEKVTDAPATITRFDANQFANTVGNSFAPALKEAKGLDFIQVGITAVAVNARGFNSAFNNRMLMMEDNRIAVLPENGLPAGGFTPIPKVDLAGMEVLVGPGSALYGPDASNGVITLQSKDPREYRGVTAEVSGGSRNFYDMQARYADVSGKIGYKFSAEYLTADDFQNVNYYGPVTKPGPPPASSGPVLENGTDWKTNVLRGYGALAYYFDNGGKLDFSAGASKSNGIGQTSVGRNQLIDWEYRTLQLKYTSPRWFAQVYRTQSLSGGTFQLNGYSQNALRFPTISADSAKRLSAFPADGRLLAAEVQGNFMINMIGTTGVSALDNTHVVAGVQTRRDYVSSFQRWLSDRNTGKELEIGSTGGYFQTETPFSSMVRLVLAGRVDKHDKYDAQFSPKAAVLLTPWEDQTFRVSYNKAFKSPSVLQTDFYFPNFSPSVGVFGNQDGFTIKNVASGLVTTTFDPIKPEINTTYEVGYKGIIANRLYIDITGYSSKYENFISPLIVIANPFAGAAATRAFNTKTGAEAGGTGANQIALTYVNLGDATILGTDIGARLILTPKIGASGNMSLQKVDQLNQPAGALIAAGTEATSFNSPVTKVTAGMDFTDLGVQGLMWGFTGRYVLGYGFRSGVNVGKVPTFGTIDLSASYKLPIDGMRLNVSVQNLFSCSAGTYTAPTFLAATNPGTVTGSRRCGFGEEHNEMINMPAIGTMIFVGVRIDR